jgi:very-short-patch-repair endonuclease
LRKVGNERWDTLIAQVAARQHGLVTTAQLEEIGLASGTITAWARAGRLHRIHRGVYAVGHAGLSLPGRWMAAVLACGPGAVLSHRSAAFLWRMLKPTEGPVHVTVPPTGGRAQRKGLVIHRATLIAKDTMAKAGIPLTSPTRTLLDLRRSVPGNEYRTAMRQAEFERLPIELPTDGTRSEQERRFLALCRRHRLPPPEPNQRLGPWTVDFLWRPERLVVETDSWSAHGGRVAYAEDRERDLWLKLRGYDVVRFTNEQLRREPAAVASAVRQLLRRRAPAA